MAEYEQVLSTALLYVLTLLRCGGLAIFTPFFGSEIFAANIRVLLVSAFALLMLPAAGKAPEWPAQVDVPELAILAAQEVSIGLMVGFLSSFVFLGAQLAGELAGQQIGFSMANVVDPMTEQEVPIIGFFQMNLATMLFVTAKLHLVILAIMWLSYDLVPIGSLVPEIMIGASAEAGVTQMEALYTAALQLGMPVMLVMLMNGVVEGFVTRTIPQMNIMVLGLPLRLVIGTSALLILLPAICWALVPADWTFNIGSPPDGIFGDMLHALDGFMQSLADGGGHSQ